MNGMGGSSSSSSRLTGDQVSVRPIGQRSVVGGGSGVEQLLKPPSVINLILGPLPV